MRPVAAEAARLTAASLARRGGGTLARLKPAWSAVVGAELAAATWPERLGRDGVLKLRVVPGVAIELQHRAPLVIERINLFLGRAAVSRLAFVQGPLPLPSPPPAAMRSAVPSPLPAAEAAALEARLAAIADPDLHAALAGLGRLMLGAAKREPR